MGAVSGSQGSSKRDGHAYTVQGRARTLLRYVTDAIEEIDVHWLGCKNPAEAEDEACITPWRKLKNTGHPLCGLP